MTRVDLKKKYDLTNINWASGIGGSSDGVLPKNIIETNTGTLYRRI